MTISENDINRIVRAEIEHLTRDHGVMEAAIRKNLEATISDLTKENGDLDRLVGDSFEKNWRERLDKVFSYGKILIAVVGGSAFAGVFAFITNLVIEHSRVKSTEEIFSNSVNQIIRDRINTSTTELDAIKALLQSLHEQQQTAESHLIATASSKKEGEKFEDEIQEWRGNFAVRWNTLESRFATAFSAAESSLEQAEGVFKNLRKLIDEGELEITERDVALAVVDSLKNSPEFGGHLWKLLLPTGAYFTIPQTLNCPLPTREEGVLDLEPIGFAFSSLGLELRQTCNSMGEITLRNDCNKRITEAVSSVSHLSKSFIEGGLRLCRR